MNILKNLTFQVISAIILGIIIGHYFPSFAIKCKSLSDIFINLIKLVIAPIIFLTIVTGVSNVGDIRKVGRIGGKALLYFEVVTTFALLIGICVANVVKPGLGLNISTIKLEDTSKIIEQSKNFELLDFLTQLIPSNILNAFVQGNMLQILLFSILFGVGLVRLGDSGLSLVNSFERMSKVFFEILNFLMVLAPLAAFGGIAFTVGKYGLITLLPLAKLVLSYYTTMFLFVFIILNLLLSYYKVSLWKVLLYIKQELLTVLGTASSESALPQVMEKLEKLGCSKSIVGLVMPAGYSFNMDGTAIYLSMAIYFLAQVFSINLTVEQQLVIFGVMMITSKGTAGVFGVGFIILASTLITIKIIPIEGLALLLGVDRFMGEVRSITNIIGNTVATIFVSCNENKFDYRKMNDVFKSSKLL